MKKIILLLMMTIFALPAMSVCSITGGACSASSNWESTPLQEKYLPDRLQDLQKTNAFQRQYKNPYNDALINTEASSKTSEPPTNDYNSNCQFGVCLPGAEPGANLFE